MSVVWDSGGGAPANCPSDWTEVDAKVIREGGGFNNRRTCIK